MLTAMLIADNASATVAVELAFSVAFIAASSSFKKSFASIFLLSVSGYSYFVYEVFLRYSEAIALLL